MMTYLVFTVCEWRLTKKAEPPPTRGVNRDSGTASANGGWLRRRLVRRHFLRSSLFSNPFTWSVGSLHRRSAKPLAHGRIRRRREVVLANILHDKGGFGPCGFSRIADLLGARPGFGIAGHHEKQLALQQFVVLQPAAAFDDKECGETPCDLAVGFVDEARGGMGSVGETSEDSMRWINIRDHLVQFCQHGFEARPHLLAVLGVHDKPNARSVGLGHLKVRCLEERDANADEIPSLTKRPSHARVAANAAVPAVEENKQREFSGRVKIGRKENRHLRRHVRLLEHRIERGRHIGKLAGKRAAGNQLGRRFSRPGAARGHCPNQRRRHRTKQPDVRCYEVSCHKCKCVLTPRQYGWR